MNFKKAYSFLIQPQTVDFSLKVTISGLTDLLMNAAGLHADEFGFGTRKLGDEGNAWVLLRSVIEIQQFPLQFEMIHIETWIEDIGRVNTHRNFIIRNDDQKVIGYAIFNWAMIDYNTRKMKDLLSLNNILHVATGETVPVEKPVKLEGVDGNPVDIFRVKYSHIDFNQHVNTMRYVEWVSNIFSLDHYKQFTISKFEMNFMSEILFDEEVSLYVKRSGDQRYNVEIKNNGKTSCRAGIIFK